VETTTSAAVSTHEALLRACEERVLACAKTPAADAASLLAAVRPVAGTVATYDPEPALLEALYLRTLFIAGAADADRADAALGTATVAQAQALARLGRLELGNLGQRALGERAAGAASALSASQAEALRRMLLAVVTDPRLVLALIAEQLERLRIARGEAVGRQRALAAETQALYAPLANRLGLGMLKWELEDYAFRYLWPEDYRRIALALNEKRADREAYIAAILATLRRELATAGVEASVEGRPKHIYSIWRKMQAKGLAFEQVYDVRAVRILVATVADCYAALGVVHGLWPYIAGEFDDYIATPKANGYRSIHTAVHADGGRTLEVQIRTREMHERSELGIAAHWRYKEGAARDLAYERKLERLRTLLSPTAIVGDGPRDLLSTLATDLFAERVYVFSPKGDVTELAAGSTPVDFAYHLHTDLGHRCRGAKINGRMVPLDYRLQNGDSVEIITGKQAQPSRDWLIESLGFLATRSARAKVRTYFRKQDEGTNRQAGREILARELAKLGAEEAVSLPELITALDAESADHLHLLLGEGEISAAQVAGALRRILKGQEPEPETIEPKPAPATATAEGIQVMGIGDLLTTYARCCRPVPPEPIQGYVTVGRGVTIHRADCANLKRLKARHPERQIPVDWGQQAERLFPVEFSVHATDRRGLVRDVSAVLADARLSIERMSTLTDAGGATADMRLTVRVHSVDELEKVFARIRSLPDVVSVRRR
jgi:GTP pyrophosphokinase